MNLTQQCISLSLAEREQAKESAKKEIRDMFAAYKKRWPHVSGLLVGSSLVGNKEGDSARFWHLTKKFNLENGLLDTK